MARYKKNYLNGSLFGTFSSNPADKVNYLFNNIIDAHYDYLLTNEEGEFNAVVLSGLRSGDSTGVGPMPHDAKIVNLNDNQHIKIKIRRTNVNGGILPDPSPNFTTNVDEESFIIGMHEWAISDKPLGDANAINGGMQVRCYYADGREFGLNSKQLFFKSSEIIEGFIAAFARPFVNVGAAIGDMFEGIQDITTVAALQIPVVKGSEVYTLDIYRDIARRIKGPILDKISAIESGNNPVICNYGSAGKGQPIGRFPEWENLTFLQIRQIQMTGIGPDGTDYRRRNLDGQLRNPFAVGLYQIVNSAVKESPRTMDFVIGVLPELGNLKFTAANQAIAGAILIMNKRPIIGNYLLGKHDNAVEAGQNWAMEWAYAPSQYNFTRGEGKNAVYIKAGESYYSGVGGNKSGTTPQAIRTQLKAGRNAMLGFSVASGGFAESDSSAIQEFGTSDTSDPYDPYATSEQ